MEVKREMNDKLYDASLVLENTESDEERLNVLPRLLQELSYEDKLELMSDILCEEWHLIIHYEFIKSVLDIFAKSLL
jgi:hypothetical protein